jgi:hypothetical protein
MIEGANKRSIGAASLLQALFQSLAREAVPASRIKHAVSERFPAQNVERFAFSKKSLDAAASCVRALKESSFQGNKATTAAVSGPHLNLVTDIERLSRGAGYF